jgi:hypothetical protein
MDEVVPFDVYWTGSHAGTTSVPFDETTDDGGPLFGFCLQVWNFFAPQRPIERGSMICIDGHTFLFVPGPH